MVVYKFKDNVDGNFAFICAKNKELAVNKLKECTSIAFTLIEQKNIEDIDKVIILSNKILPF